ncbi:MAG: hypothetical protein KDD04_06940 [Sinomicrobium sp.]|nr:hypothetical protein [Sinomicrobium sp.]
MKYPRFFIVPGDQDKPANINLSRAELKSIYSALLDTVEQDEANGASYLSNTVLLDKLRQSIETDSKRH